MSWEKKNDAAIGSLPVELRELTQELTTATHGFRQTLAKRLEPVLNAHLRTMPQETLEQKKAICKLVENILEPLGIAVKSPNTDNLPGKLKATTGHWPSIGCFHFEVYIDGKQKKPAFSDKLPKLELIDANPAQALGSPMVDALPPSAPGTHFRDLVEQSQKKATESAKSVNYASLSSAFTELTNNFRKDFIAQLLPVLKEEIRHKKHDTYEEKKELVKWVNAELRRFDLAIKSPTTGNPSSFKANPLRNPEVGRFLLVSVDADEVEKTFSATKIETLLDKLELMDAPERRESILEWQEKVGRNRGGAERS